MSEIMHFNKYSVVGSNFEIKLNLSRLSTQFKNAQNDLNNQVMLDCMDYVPFQQDNLSNSVHVENDDEIVWNTPYARFLYMGKVMVDERGSTYAKKHGKKHVINKDLTYSKEAHKKADSHWFERAKDDHLQDWINTVKKAVK